MKRFDVHDSYVLGKVLGPIVNLASWTQDVPIKQVILPLLQLRLTLMFRVTTMWPSEMTASRRAALAVLKALDDLGIPVRFDEGTFDPERLLPVFQLNSLTQRAKDLESVLANEVPGLAVWYVGTKGIYSTDALISEAWKHLIVAPDDVVATARIEQVLPAIAKEDINEAGRALALDLPTATGFHLWRAVETVMGEYYKHLTSGRTFKDDEIKRNWYAYIEALKKAGAEPKVTNLLEHIRGEYRNPTMHPEETLKADEAFALFGAGLSVISQTLRILMPAPPPPPTTTPLPPPAIT